MNHSEKLAIAAHLHVLLRRNTGRVTDTEWMASHGSYAREIVRFARERAVQDQAPELVEWADRLEHCMQDTLAAELRRSAREAVAARSAEHAAAPAVHTMASAHPQARRYVGGIR